MRCIDDVDTPTRVKDVPYWLTDYSTPGVSLLDIWLSPTAPTRAVLWAAIQASGLAGVKVTVRGGVLRTERVSGNAYAPMLRSLVTVASSRLVEDTARELLGRQIDRRHASVLRCVEWTVNQRWAGAASLAPMAEVVASSSLLFSDKQGPMADVVELVGAVVRLGTFLLGTTTVDIQGLVEDLCAGCVEPHGQAIFQNTIPTTLFALATRGPCNVVDLL